MQRAGAAGRFVGVFSLQAKSAGVCVPAADGTYENLLDGSAVTVKLYKPVNGLKEQAGTLAAYEDGAVTIRQGEKEVRFEKSEVAQVRLRAEF